MNVIIPACRFWLYLLRSCDVWEPKKPPGYIWVSTFPSSGQNCQNWIGKVAIKLRKFKRHTKKLSWRERKWKITGFDPGQDFRCEKRGPILAILNEFDATLQIPLFKISSVLFCRGKTTLSLAFQPFVACCSCWELPYWKSEILKLFFSPRPAPSARKLPAKRGHDVQWRILSRKIFVKRWVTTNMMAQTRAKQLSLEDHHRSRRDCELLQNIFVKFANFFVCFLLESRKLLANFASHDASWRLWKTNGEIGNSEIK